MDNLKRGRYLVVLLVTCYVVSGCVEKEPDKDELIQEIMTVEKQFNDYASKHGVEEAFLEFAAESAVLNRGGQIIKGKDAIRNYFEGQPYSNVALSWKPDFADVSEDGKMAYTYGPFTFSAIDSLNNPVKTEGIFHTVWKRQDDGSWKYVYD